MNHHKTILLVEDNPDDADLMIRSLRQNRIANEVVVAHDGAEALDYLFCTGSHAGRNGDLLPEVVLLDLRMPKVDGLEVLRRVRADDRTKLLPVVVLTSSDEDRDIVDSFRFGCNSYVRKPVEFNEFSEAVKQLGLYWLVLNQSPNR
jgi:CheY-like chemotaxis protein